MKVLVTGCAGFIGSHISAALLSEGHKVVGVDNLSTGAYANLYEFNTKPGFDFYSFDLTDGMTLRKVFLSQKDKGDPITHVCHQAALGSVPRSMEMPTEVFENNVRSLHNVLEMARCFKVDRVVFASSSSVYGDDTSPVKKEQNVGKALSPYAYSKQVNESMADLYARVFGVKSIGLRYFNVFGARQSQAGPYAPVIAKWVNLLRQNKPIEMHGDGETSRDFCYVKNVVQANLLALKSPAPAGVSSVCNIACGEQTSLNRLLSMLMTIMEKDKSLIRITRHPERNGDIKSSLADTSRARTMLGYNPRYSVDDGLREMLGTPKADSAEFQLPQGVRAAGWT